VRIATFNIDNVNRRLPNLLGWLATSAPDVVCLQELKCAQADFPADAIHKAGYHAVWKGERSWNGVAILARKSVRTHRLAWPNIRKEFSSALRDLPTRQVPGQCQLLALDIANFRPERG
jgi:exonuclease III